MNNGLVASEDKIEFTTTPEPDRVFLTSPPGTASFDAERHGGLGLRRRKRDVGGPSYY